MSVLVFDIETVPCAFAGPPRADPDRPDRLAPPAHHRIVAIGYVWLDRRLQVQRMGCRGGEERQIVADFMAGVHKAAPLLVGANTRGFDLPCLVARCFHHGVRFPFRLGGKDVWYRYRDDAHIDVMDLLCGYGAGKQSSVDAWAKLAGFPGKMGITGDDVERLVAEQQWDVLHTYALTDAIQETAIFLRTEFIRGAVPAQVYQAAATSLLAAIEADKHAAPMLGLIDRPRFLLADAETAEAAE